MGPASIPRLDEVAINGRVLFVSAAVSLGTGLFAALWPALRLVRSANLGTGMRDVGTTAVTAAGSRLRLSLVIGQLAAAVVLGVGASLLMNALVQVSHRDLGFEPQGLTTIAVPMKQPGMQGTTPAVLWDRAVFEVQAVSGIAHVAAASDPPFADSSWAPWLSLPGDAPGSRRAGVMAFVVTPGFVETVGASLMAGRDFSAADSGEAEPVVIVNQAFVSPHLAGRSPLGSVVLVRNEGSDTDTPRKIVGVVADIVQRRLEDAVAPALYVPHHQVPWPFTLNLLVSSERTGPVFSDELRRAVGRFSPSVPITAMYPLTAPMERTLVEPKFRAGLFASFAGVSMLLAVIGLYGSLSHTVGRRSRELGLRMALGADRRSIFSMVLRQGAMVAGLGLSLGLAGAVLMARTLQGFLYGASPLDPLTFAATALALGVVALLAALSPARRAARVDVMTSLRE
jgi:predicted permease